MDIKINDELKNLMPPLEDDEYKTLEESILKEGCRESLLVWDNVIIDGHNRYDICRKHNIPFNTKEIEFDSIEQAKIWMIDNQKGRRNLTDGWKWELAQVRRKLLLEKGLEKKYSGINQHSKGGLSFNDKPSRTQKTLAEELGWSTGKVGQAEQVWKRGDDEIKEKVKAGNMTIGGAYKEVKKQEKKKKLQEKKKEYKEQSKKKMTTRPTIKVVDAVKFLSSFEDNSIDLLLTDPPYMTDLDDVQEFTKKWLSVALKKIKKSGRAYIFSGAYPKEMQAFLNVLINQNKFIVDSPLIWTYRNTLGQTPKMKYNLNYQLAWHLYSNESDELDTSITKEMFSVQDINAPDGRQGNRLHTWQKPDELAKRLIRHSTKKGDLVVDCFACTGTFLIEAAKLNRKTMGGDISIENLKIAEERGCIITGG